MDWLTGGLYDVVENPFWDSPWGKALVGAFYVFLGFVGSRFFQKRDLKRERQTVEHDRHTESLEKFAIDARATYENLQKFQHAYISEMEARYHLKDEARAERFDKEGTMLASKVDGDLANLRSSLRELSVKVPDLKTKAQAICDDIAEEYELTYQTLGNETSAKEVERFMAPFEADLRERKGLPPVQEHPKGLLQKVNPRTWLKG